jgi:hypothetical protein
MSVDKLSGPNRRESWMLAVGPSECLLQTNEKFVPLQGHSGAVAIEVDGKLQPFLCTED